MENAYGTKNGYQNTASDGRSAKHGRCRLQLLRDRFFQLVELYVKIFKTVSNLRENSQHAGPSFGLFARLNLHVLDPPR
jgi:hypothetical protein